MSNTLVRVKCGNCQQYHDSAAAVKNCYFPPTPSPAPAAVASFGLPAHAAPTERQLDYVRDLGGDVDLARKYTRTGISLYITRLKAAKKEAQPVTAPVQPKVSPNTTTKIPLSMLHDVPDGYYATQQDSTRPFVFFKISRPKSGHFKGALKIMTQHGPDYKLALVVYSGDRIYWSNKAVEDDLLLVVVDKNGCAIAYSEKIGRCMRCNTELTDDHSRWYGIGPECVKHWPHMIDLVDDRKGPYRPGS